MNPRLLASLVLIATCLSGVATAAQPELVWTTSGLKAPESAVHDTARDLFYVSNVNGQPQAADGNGAISRVGPKGELLEYAWVGGLDAPKGLAVARGEDGSGDRLYAADIDTLIEIDIESGRIVNRYTAEGVKSLNDVTVAAGGAVYVSDMGASAIYRLHNGAFEPWLSNDSGALCTPNGVLAGRERLIVGCWQAGSGEGAGPGRLLAVDYDDKTVTSLTGPLGHIDGVEADAHGGYYITDWMAGGLWHITNGEAEQLLDLDRSSADLAYVSGRNLVVIPMMLDNSLRAYRLP